MIMIGDWKGDVSLRTVAQYATNSTRNFLYLRSTGDLWLPFLLPSTVGCMQIVLFVRILLVLGRTTTKFCWNGSTIASTCMLAVIKSLSFSWCSILLCVWRYLCFVCVWNICFCFVSEYTVIRRNVVNSINLKVLQFGIVINEFKKNRHKLYENNRKKTAE